MLLLVGAVFVVIIAIALVGGKAAFEHKQRLRATGGRAQGQIVRNRADLSSGTTVFWPVVRFATHKGSVIEGEQTNGSALSIPRYEVGVMVWVAYDKANPQDFVLLTPGRFA
jgi:hypothetical protein